MDKRELPTEVLNSLTETLTDICTELDKPGEDKDLDAARGIRRDILIYLLTNIEFDMLYDYIVLGKSKTLLSEEYDYNLTSVYRVLERAMRKYRVVQDIITSWVK